MQVGLLNVDGYYNSLLTFIDKAVEEGFINPSARRIIVLAPTAQELMDKLEVCAWIDDQNLLPNSVHHPLLMYVMHLVQMRSMCRSTSPTTTGWRPRSTGRWATSWATDTTTATPTQEPPEPARQRLKQPTTARAGDWDV